MAESKPLLEIVEPQDEARPESEPEMKFSEASASLIAEHDGVDVTSYRLPPFPHPLRHPVRCVLWLIRAAFGIISLILLLAVVAAIPIVNFLAMGYLLEVEARVARTGRLRDALLLLDVAPRIGSIVFGIWLWLLPLRLLATARVDAYWIDPGGDADQFMALLTPIATAIVSTHLCLALARGGSFACFFRPIRNIRWLIERFRNADYMAHATAGVQDFMQRLRLQHHFLLGFQGFLGAFAWLLLPSALFASAVPGGGGRNVISFVGALGLILCFLWVPFLQARFAVTGHWRSMFDLSTVRELFRYAPLAWLIAIAVTYVLTLPLYLAKVYLLPQDLMWLITIIFIVTIFPARVVTGWAMHRAIKRKERPGSQFAWLSRSIMLPLIGLYVFLLFFTPLISEHGKGVLFEHHALLLPVPFGL